MPQATPIPGTDDDPYSPFFSPDSKQIGFYADGHMKRIAVTGGAAVELGAIDAPFGASWADNGMIYFGRGGGGRRPATRSSTGWGETTMSSV